MCHWLGARSLVRWQIEVLFQVQPVFYARPIFGPQLNLDLELTQLLLFANLPNGLALR